MTRARRAKLVGGGSVLAALALAAAAAAAHGRTAGPITYIVPAGQTKHESKPTLTGAGQYSYLAPTFDRAAKNGYPNKAANLGEVYLGDGGATATYRIKTLSPTPRRFVLWLYVNDDGVHPAGTRTVVISIPALHWSRTWSNAGVDTHGWLAVKIGTITSAGGFTISFRKQASTPAAFIMNAFALTTAAGAPAFGPVASANVSYVVPAGQTAHESKPTLTGAGQYSYLAPTFDRAAKNHYAHTSPYLGEVYLGDGGATATYRIKTLARTPQRLTVWINVDDDGVHAAGTRTVVISIPALHWTRTWSNPGKSTNGWRAVKIGTITSAGGFTISFRKQASTPAAFIMNAFAFTTAAQSPFG